MGIWFPLSIGNHFISKHYENIVALSWECVSWECHLVKMTATNLVIILSTSGALSLTNTNMKSQATDPLFQQPCYFCHTNYYTVSIKLLGDRMI